MQRSGQLGWCQYHFRSLSENYMLQRPRRLFLSLSKKYRALIQLCMAVIRSGSSNEEDEHKQEEQQHCKDLHDQPAIGGDAVHVLEQLRLRRVHVGHGVIYIFINSNCQLPLLLNLHITDTILNAEMQDSSAGEPPLDQDQARPL